MRSSNPAMLPLVMLAAWACSEPDAPRAVDPDAAVVTYSEFPPTGAARWTLSDEPELSIGVVDGDPEYQFSRIAGVVPFRGGVLVADGGSGEVRAFDAEGVHVATAGGSGEGPGEFALLRGLAVARGDTVLGWDFRTRRVTLFDEALALIDTRPVSPDQLNAVWGAFADGDLLVWPFEIAPPAVSSPRLLEARSFFAVARLADPTTLDTILDFTSRQSWAMPDGTITVPFTQGPTVTAGPAHVWGGNGSDGSFARYDRVGARELEIALPPGGPVTESAIDTYVASVLESVPPDARDLFEAAFDEMPLPERLPAFSRLLPDNAGNIWVRAYQTPEDETPRRWAVFDDAGAAVGTLEIPRALTLHSVREGRLYGVWRDELGVETVRVYGITSPG